MPRDFKKATDNAHLSKLQSDGLTPNQIAEAFGVSVFSVNAWLNGERSCPYWTKIAAEGITRRMDNTRQSTLLVHCPRDQESNITTIVASLGATVTSIKL